MSLDCFKGDDNDDRPDVRVLVRRRGASIRHRDCSTSGARRLPHASGKARLNHRGEHPSVCLNLQRIDLNSRSPSKRSLTKPSARSLRGDRPPHSSSLLKLPSEVRQCILRYLIPMANQDLKFYTDCDTTFTDDKWQSQRKKESKDQFSLAILRTNRVLYHEALAVLYSTKTFHFIGSNYLPILDFFRRLSPDAKALVRRIRITWLEQDRSPRDAQFNLFCMAILDFLPGLISFDSGTWIWF